ncbi:MAG: hypothetical protein GXC73_04220 [Chitinophagaceae bacterium]|nr:hypothetical protein [Chitinophagaceae bacterium]
MIRFISKSIVVLIITCTQLQAQIKQPKYEAGIAAGAFVYQGDLTPYRFGSLKTMRPGLLLHGSRLLSATIAVRLQLSIASLYGDDAKYNNPAYRQQRNFNFRTSLIEVSPQFVWSPLGWSDAGKQLSPYLFGGAAVSLVRIRRDASAFNAAYFEAEPELFTHLATDLSVRTPRLMSSVPVGAGMRYSISPAVVLHAEASYRFLFTDYLDGFSRAANPERNDHYYNIAVGVIYRFGRRNSWDCPPVR